MVARTDAVDGRRFAGVSGDLERLDELARRVHGRLMLDDASTGRPAEPEIRSLVEMAAPLLSTSQLDSVVRRVTQLLFGLGPLEAVLADPDVTEVMVNGPGPVWVERDGELRRTDLELDDDALRMIVDRIVGPLGLRVDRTAPFVDARLPDGSRVNIAVPPLAVDGPYLTVRRFRATPFELGDFCTPAVESVLRTAVRSRQSIVVSGGTGSGKTSLLNSLAAHIEQGVRVVTIEDAAELRLPGDHTVRLEARPANAEGVGAVSIRELLRNALRMRPDRLIIGEVRGAEALDMIQAMNTGHDGSMSTCHANSPLDALRRIEAMALMGDVQLPVAVVREHLWAAVDLVVHVARDDAGRRAVRSVYRCNRDVDGAERGEPRRHRGEDPRAQGPRGEWLVRPADTVPEPDTRRDTARATERG